MLKPRHIGLIPAIIAFGVAMYYNITVLHIKYGSGVWMLFLLNLLPGFVLLGIYQWTRSIAQLEWSFWSIMRFALRIVGVAFVLIVALCTVLFFNQLTFWDTDITKTSAYPQLLREHRADCKNWTAHFPAEIPREAQHFRLYYSPAFMQGA